MGKIHAALMRFKAIVDGEECLCDDVHRCTVHMDRITADMALEEYDNIESILRENFNKCFYCGTQTQLRETGQECPMCGGRPA